MKKRILFVNSEDEAMYQSFMDELHYYGTMVIVDSIAELEMDETIRFLWDKDQIIKHKQKRKHAIDCCFLRNLKQFASTDCDIMCVRVDDKQELERLKKHVLANSADISFDMNSIFVSPTYTTEDQCSYHMLFTDESKIRPKIRVLLGMNSSYCRKHA